MPDEFLTKEEVEEFSKNLDYTLGYMTQVYKTPISQEDLAYYTAAYFILKKLEEIL